MARTLDPLVCRRSPGGFLSVELNVVGWAALLGAGLVVGAVATILTPLPLVAALIAGPLVVYCLVRVWDYRRLVDSTVGLGYGDLDAATGAALVSELMAMGIAATYEEHVFDDGEIQRSIVCRQRDADAVRELMGLRIP